MDSVDMALLERQQGFLQNSMLQNQSMHQEMFDWPKFSDKEIDLNLPERKIIMMNQERDVMTKRKAEFGIPKEGEGKRVKGEVKLGSNENSPDTSKEESKTSQAGKTGYIHVRARRGQATDNHSLAERARREKISRKMKCLQELVPGCDKIIGKTGILDVIINYVQSLQRQVEFLSMKLAASSTRTEFSIDNLFPKEFPAHVAGSPAATVSSEVADNPCFQLSLVHQQTAETQLDVVLNSLLQTAPENSTSSCLSTAELCPDSSNFPQLEALPTWNDDLHSIYNVGFH